MKTRKNDSTGTPVNTGAGRQRRPQQSIWFWLAAALIPEAAAYQVESPRAMAQRIELLRAGQAGNDGTTDGDERAAA